jgi:feruloyl esterase
MKNSLRALLAAALLSAPLMAASSCESLTSLALPDTTITSAQSMAAGSFALPNGNTLTNLPAFCEVHGILKPTSVSKIHFEIWMPVANWNGRFEVVGNGGLAGNISFPAMAIALRNGYATASTDTGHTAADPKDWLGDRELLTDFGSRGLHLTTVAGKSVVKAFYGRGSNYAYFSGCSTGGRQGLMEAQRFPADFDGIVAGDAGYQWTHQMATQVWTAIATGAPETNFTQENLELIQKTVLAACDAHDGATDGIISSPTTCHFDPKKLLCNGGSASSCLTQGQVTALEKIYSGPSNPRTGEKIYPGPFPGSEVGWGKAGGTPLINHSTSSGLSSYDFWAYTLFKNPAWDFHKFDFDRDIQTADEKLAPVTDSTDPNLEPFRKIGHKLIYYHGSSDPIVPLQMGINYFERVVAAQKSLEGTQKFFRAFPVPGMYHCQGGPGANAFGTALPAPAAQMDADHDVVTSLARWVEKGVAPEKIIATKYAENNPAKGIAMQRPLCPYPLVPKYKGSGDMNNAGSFSCKKP